MKLALLHYVSQAWVSLKSKGGLVRASLKHEERRFYTFKVILLPANHTRYFSVDNLPDLV